MLKMMKVSIITACYNRKETIGKAIESVLRQTYPDIEYIVVDGGSSDGSTSVIEECLRSEEFFAEQSGKAERRVKSEELRSEERRVKSEKLKFVVKPDHGMYEGLNNGIRMATGDIIGLCHSDDQLFDEKTIEKVVRTFEEHPEADMVYADGLYVNPENGRAVRVWKGKPLKRWRLRCGWLPLHTTCYVRREVHERYGLYDERYKIAADTKLLLTLLYQQRIKAVWLPQYVVRMQMGGASTDRERRKDMWREDVRVFRELGFRWPNVMKIMKMAWKPAQFIWAKI